MFSKKVLTLGLKLSTMISPFVLGHSSVLDRFSIEFGPLLVYFSFPNIGHRVACHNGDTHNNLLTCHFPSFAICGIIQRT